MATDILSSLNKNGSGLNIRELTTSLVAAEIQPRQNAIEKKVAATQTSISALGKLRAGMDKLDSALGTIAATPILAASVIGSSTTLVPTDKSQLTEGSTSFDVQSLATRQVLEFTGFTSESAPIGSGTLTVETGTWTDAATNQFTADPTKPVPSLTIGAGATLKDIAAALNTLDGVSARVIDKGDGTFSLGVVSEMGAASGLRFTATEAAESPGLAAFDLTTTVASRQVQGAADAVLKVDGLTIRRPTNAITDVMPGARIDLVATGKTEITISRDQETAAANMASLVDSINETLTMLKSMTSRGQNGTTRGELAGELAIDGISARIQSLIAQPFSGHGRNKVFLAELGVATERNGTLRFDREAFDASFAADPVKFEAAFSNSLESKTPGVSITGTPPRSTPSGVFDFVRDSATGAAKLGGAPAFGTLLDDGRSRLVPLGGPLSGTVLTADAGINLAKIEVGVSFVSLLQNELATVLGKSGSIAKRETQLSDNLLTEQENTKTLEAKASLLETRYLERFTAMEIAISQLKSTGNYITNMVDSWNRDA